MSAETEGSSKARGTRTFLPIEKSAARRADSEEPKVLPKYAERELFYAEKRGAEAPMIERLISTCIYKEVWYDRREV